MCSTIYDEFQDTFDNDLIDKLKEKVEDICDGSKCYEECLHNNIVKIDDIEICSDCGIEKRNVVYEPEWRYYGGNDNKSVKNPSRCHISKHSQSKIEMNVQNLNLPEYLKVLTERKFSAIVKNNTTRGANKEAIIAACLLHSYREINDCRTTDEIRNMFNITKKDMTSGLTKYYEVFKEDRTKHIKPENLIRRILILTGVDMIHYHKIVEIARYLDNTSRSLNHSNPKSVASAIVFLYLSLHPEYRDKLSLSKANFSDKVGLSDITITKLAKEASLILCSEEKVDV